MTNWRASKMPASTASTMPPANSHAVRYEQAIDRLQRLVQRLLEKDIPVHPRNECPGRQDRTPVGIFPEIDRLRLHHAGHLGKFGKIGAQSHFGIGMRDQSPSGTNHERIDILADPASIDQRRNELEIDFRDGRSGIAAGMRHRNRHERIRPVEINRRQPDRLALRFLESRIARIIGPACHSGLAARQSELLPALAVEIDQPVDGRHLLKQQRVIRAPLLDCGAAGACRPADLTLDFGDELLNPAGRRLGIRPAWLFTSCSVVSR